MRILFYTILISVGLCLSIAILVPSFFDVNTYKTRIYKFVESQTGYKLEIKGPIRISVFPKLNLNADDITLRNNKEVLFKAKNLNIYPSLFSFFKGNVSFNGIKLDTAKIFIKKNKDKTYNWNTKKLEKKGSHQKETDGTKVISKNKNNNFLITRNLYLSNSAIEYQDVNAKRNIEKIFINFKQNTNNNFKFDGGFYLNNKEYKLKYSAQLLKMNISFDGKLNSEYFNFDNSGQYNVDLRKGTFSFSGNLKNLKSLTKIDDLKINELYLSSKLNIENNNFDFNNLKILIKDENLYGNANLKINKNKRDISLFLNTDFLNINKIYSSKEQNKAVAKKSKNIENNNKNKTKNLNKNIFEITNGLNINSNLSAKKILYKNVYLDDVKLILNKKNNIKINIKAKNFFKSELDSKFILNKKMEYSFNNSLKGFSLRKLNDYYKVDLINGTLDLNSSLKGVIKSNNDFFPFREILFNSNGVSTLLGNELVIKNLNLNDFKEKVSKLNNINQIKELKKSLFKGDTALGNQELKILHEKEVLNLPLTKLKVDEEVIGVSGKYNINNKKIELISNYVSKNSFLSLFSIKTKGKISNPTSTISFDEKAVSTLIEKLVEKKLKKSLEKKLEKKFDNIIDNLLEEL